MLPSLGMAAILLGTATASPHEFNLFPKRASNSSCSGNTASTRSEWCDYSIDTDYYSEAPDTGVTREYWVCASTTYPVPLHIG